MTMDVMKKILNELKTYLDNASPEELKQLGRHSMNPVFCLG